MRIMLTPAVLLLLAGCAPSAKAPATPQQVTFTAKEFAYSGPDSIAPGVTRITMVNAGTQPHHLIMGRLDDGKTIADVQAAMKEHPQAAPPYLSYRGAANMIDPGDSSTSVSDLPAGHYMLICFVPDPADRTPHAFKGMTKELVVAGPRHDAPLPIADAEIRLSDFTFASGDIAAGTHTFHVVNDGPQIHEIQLVRLNDGTTTQQFTAALAPGAAGPPPGAFLGGPGALSVGEDDYWTVTLKPGSYLFLCFVPDTASGAPHFTKGMIREVKVS